MSKVGERPDDAAVGQVGLVAAVGVHGTTKMRLKLIVQRLLFDVRQKGRDPPFAVLSFTL